MEREVDKRREVCEWEGCVWQCDIQGEVCVETTERIGAFFLGVSNL